ncbi:cadherin-86C isoform X3 [Acetobacter orientalis]|uniref:Cadherin-86C isoform X3 n=1 Tax=Acetobacter orientalis TaxID=146474 RepID=A0A2Z5ZG10_9PROT|nr:cadherin-86C isoform X3 [Acetobacter orientalis]
MRMPYSLIKLPFYHHIVRSTLLAQGNPFCGFFSLNDKKGI